MSGFVFVQNAGFWFLYEMSFVEIVVLPASSPRIQLSVRFFSRKTECFLKLWGAVPPDHDPKIHTDITALFCFS